MDSFRLLCVLVLTAAGLRASEPTVIPLWPEGVPAAQANAAPERDENDHVANVQVPTLTWYPAPAATANRCAVIVCPGGGYRNLSWKKEGTRVAEWLNSIGVTAFVLKYRLIEYGHPAPLRDVLRAVRTVRARADEFGLDAHRLGVLGFSAGGHLAASAGTLYDDPAGQTGAALDRVSARPDFLALIYPVILLDGPHAHAGSRAALLGADATPALVAALSPEQHVTADTPPVFLVHTEEDRTVPVENSIAFYLALRHAGVPTEMHLFEKGPHGVGLRDDLGPTSGWPRRCEEWMRSHGWLAR